MLLMFQFLFGHSAATNPQIAIPHNTPLKSLAWSSSKGWIACGGVGGLLKVLKLEPQQGEEVDRGRGVGGERGSETPLGGGRLCEEFWFSALDGDGLRE